MSAAATVEHQAAAAQPESMPPAAIPQSAASSSLPPTTKPKRRYNRFRHSPERVKDFQRMLPRQAPRLRDLRIYESVVYDQMLQHDVAQIFDITQPRVCQIVQEVRAWLSTTPWELAGMTEQQQMNLATHETRRWLDVIRKKALDAHEKTDAQCARYRTVENQRGKVSERTFHNQPPTAGFLKVALQATIKAGELGGAGQQWVASRRQTAAARPESPVHRPHSTGDGPQSPVPSPPSADRPPFLSPDPDPCGRIGISDDSTPAAERVSPCGDNDLRPGIEAGRGAAGLLKKNRPRFSLESGKANGHETSVRRGSAQIVNSRRRKEREFAYRKVADRMEVGDEGRRYFFGMLRQLDGLAQRVDSQVQRRIRIEAKKFHRTHTDRDVASLRWNKLCEMLRLDHSIRTFPYGDEWVLQEYDATTGRFRWHANGPPPAEKPPKPPDPT
jgi:hypothetical protein